MGPLWNSLTKAVGDILSPREKLKDPADRLNGAILVIDILSGGMVTESKDTLKQVSNVMVKSENILAWTEPVIATLTSGAVVGCIAGGSIAAINGSFCSDESTAKYQGKILGGGVGIFTGGLAGTLVANAFFPGYGLLGLFCGAAGGGTTGYMIGGPAGIAGFKGYSKNKNEIDNKQRTLRNVWNPYLQLRV